MVARSSAEVEFRSVAHRICEVLWIKGLLEDLKISSPLPMKVSCDNKAAISVAHNLVFLIEKSTLKLMNTLSKKSWTLD